MQIAHFYIIYITTAEKGGVGMDDLEMINIDDENIEEVDEETLGIIEEYSDDDYRERFYRLEGEYKSLLKIYDEEHQERVSYDKFLRISYVIMVPVLMISMLLMILALRL